MVKFNVIRLAVFGTVLLLSLIPLGIAANFTRPAVTVGFTFPGFSVAVAVITIVVIVACLVVDHLRRGAFTSLAAAELGWVGLLWVLWLAAAAHATNSLDFGGDCSLYVFGEVCHQFKALQAFSFLIWLILLGYWGTLLTFAILSQSRGNKRAFQTPTNELGDSVSHGGNAAAQSHIPPPATGQVWPQQTGGTVYPQTTGGTAPYPQQYGTPQYGSPQLPPQPHPQPGYPPQPTPGYAPPSGAPYSPAPHVVQV